MARVMLAELRDTAPPATADERDVGAYIDHLYDPLPPADRRRLDLALDGVASVPDADACWFVRLFYGRAIEPHPDRTRWVRTVVTMELGAASESLH